MNQAWLSSKTNGYGVRVLEGALDRALEFAEHVGVRVPETGRHRNALKLLRRFNDGTLRVRLADRALLQRLAAAHRTAWESVLIFCATSLRRRSRVSPFTLDRLDTMMGGGEVVEGRARVLVMPSLSCMCQPCSRSQERRSVVGSRTLGSGMATSWWVSQQRGFGVLSRPSASQSTKGCATDKEQRPS